MSSSEEETEKITRTKKPLSEARLAAIEKMKEGRRKQLEQKKKEKEEAQKIKKEKKAQIKEEINDLLSEGHGLSKKDLEHLKRIIDFLIKSNIEVDKTKEYQRNSWADMKTKWPWTMFKGKND